MSTEMSPEDVIEAKHALAGIAEILRSYHTDLRKQGFNRKESLAIVIDYQRVIIGGGSE